MVKGIKNDLEDIQDGSDDIHDNDLSEDDLVENLHMGTNPNNNFSRRINWVRVQRESDKEHFRDTVALIYDELNKYAKYERCSLCEHLEYKDVEDLLHWLLKQ